MCKITGTCCWGVLFESLRLLKFIPKLVEPTEMLQSCRVWGYFPFLILCCSSSWWLSAAKVLWSLGGGWGSCRAASKSGQGLGHLVQVLLAVGGCWDGVNWVSSLWEIKILEGSQDSMYFRAGFEDPLKIFHFCPYSIRRKTYACRKNEVQIRLDLRHLPRWEPEAGADYHDPSQLLHWIPLSVFVWREFCCIGSFPRSAFL